MKLSPQKRTLLILFTLFLAPLLLAMLMRSSWWAFQPGQLKNRGQLVQPPVFLSLDLRDTVLRTEGDQTPEGKWLLLYVIGDQCIKQCTQDVTAFRQIHKALGRKQNHLALAILSPESLDTELQTRLLSIYSELNFIVDLSGSSLKTLADIKTENASLNNSPVNYRTYILDPMHNVILAFGTNTNPQDIHQDLRRLLKWFAQER
jgi:hypothetical protein